MKQIILYKLWNSMYLFQVPANCFQKELKWLYTHKKWLMWCRYLYNPWLCYMDNKDRLLHKIFHRNPKDRFYCNLYRMSPANILKKRNTDTVYTEKRHLTLGIKRKWIMPEIINLMVFYRHRNFQLQDDFDSTPKNFYLHQRI